MSQKIVSHSDLKLVPSLTQRAFVHDSGDLGAQPMFSLHENIQNILNIYKFTLDFYAYLVWQTLFI